MIGQKLQAKKVRSSQKSSLNKAKPNLHCFRMPKFHLQHVRTALTLYLILSFIMDILRNPKIPSVFQVRGELKGANPNPQTVGDRYSLRDKHIQFISKTISKYSWPTGNFAEKV